MWHYCKFIWHYCKFLWHYCNNKTHQKTSNNNKKNLNFDKNTDLMYFKMFKYIYIHKKAVMKAVSHIQKNEWISMGPLLEVCGNYTL